MQLKRKVGLALLAALSLAAPAFAHVPARELAPAVDLLHAEVTAQESVQPFRIVPRDLFAELAHVEAPITSLSTTLAQRFDAQNIESGRPQTLHLTRAVRRNLTSGLHESLRRAIIKEINGLGPETRWATGTARARWYDPKTGSWLTADPLGYQDSSNLYAFCGGDPVNHRDPTGEGILEDLYDLTQTKTGRAITSGAKAVAVGTVAVITVAVVATVSVPVAIAGGVGYGLYQGTKAVSARIASGQHASTYEAVGVGVADTLGFTQIAEGASEVEVGTGRRLSRSEAGDRLGAGIGQQVVVVIAPAIYRGTQAAIRGGSAAPVTPAPIEETSSSKYHDLRYVENVMNRASKMSLNRALRSGTTGARAGHLAEATFENYALKMQLRLMESESPFRVTTQPAAMPATGMRVFARNLGSFKGARTPGAKILDYGIYEAGDGGANWARILSGGDFTVSLGKGVLVPSEYAPAFPGARIFGIDPTGIYGPP